MPEDRYQFCLCPRARFRRVAASATPPALGSARTAPTATLLAILALVLGACGGDDPAGPPQPTPDIVGSYQGDWTYILAYAPSGNDQDLVCPGTLTVDSQTPNGTFTGTWTQQLTSDDCNEAAGTLSGIVAPGGAITVVSLGSSGGGSGNTLEEVTEGECVATRIDDAYRGSADGSTFEISYAISGECGQDQAVSWVIAFLGVTAPDQAGAPAISESPAVTKGLPAGALCLESQPRIVGALQTPEQAPKRPVAAGVDTPIGVW